jgi:hypothetical protein
MLSVRQFNVLNQEIIAITFLEFNLQLDSLLYKFFKLKKFQD